MRLKNYLTEIRKNTMKGKGVTWDEVKNIYDRLKRIIRPDMTHKIGSWKGNDGEWWDLQFRAYDFYTSRPGEEDDDWPDFTGEKKLHKMIDPVLKGIAYSVQDHEKSWFSINVKQKKLTKKELRADAKKLTDDVKKKLRWAEVDTYDRWEKEKYNETSAAFKKFKNKFMKKDQFFELAKKANWHWDTDDLENFWRDI